MRIPKQQLEHRRQASLIQELDVSLYLIETGLVVLQKSRMYDRKNFAFLILLTSGFERLMKIILILHTLHTRQRFLTKKELMDRKRKHNLGAMLSEILAACFTPDYLTRPYLVEDRNFLANDATLDELLVLMTEFAESHRYAYMDAIGDPTTAVDSPDQRWDSLDLAQIPLEERVALFSENRDDEYKPRVTQSLIACLEKFARALSRLFTHGALGGKGKQVSPAVQRFAMLDDAELGKREYRL